MDIKVVLKTLEGKREEIVTISSLLFLTSTLAKLISKYNATSVEAFDESNNRIAILDVGKGE